MPIEIRETVKRREAKLPYGDVLREVRSVPRARGRDRRLPTRSFRSGRTSVRQVSTVERRGVAPAQRRGSDLRSGCAQDACRLDVRAGVAAIRVRQSRRALVVSIHGDAGAIDAKPYTIEAVATAAGKEYAKATS